MERFRMAFSGTIILVKFSLFQNYFSHCVAILQIKHISLQVFRNTYTHLLSLLIIYVSMHLWAAAKENISVTESLSIFILKKIFL